MGKRLPRCSHREHDWKPTKRQGPCREKCTKCGDVFPCRHDCEHLDCVVATGRAIPDCWANPEQARANMLEELAIIAPQVFLMAQKSKPTPEPKRAPEKIIVDVVDDNDVDCQMCADSGLMSTLGADRNMEVHPCLCDRGKAYPS